MSKLQAVLYPLSCIIDDVSREYPALCKPLQIDLHRLNQLVVNRGESILTVDLPKLGKLYDRGFQTGILDLSELPHTLGSERKRNEIFHHLLRQTYRRSGELVFPEPKIVFYTRCILFAYKKLSRVSSVAAKTKAVKDFLNIEENLSEPSRPWNSERNYLLGNRRLFFSDLAGTSSDDQLLRTLDGVCGVLGFNRIPDPRVFKFKHGPGAVSDKKRTCDKYDHITWPVRASLFFPASEVAIQESLYHNHFNLDYPLNNNENLIVAPVENLTKGSYASQSSKPMFTPVNCPASLIAVPKTVDKPRLIASEPTANQFLQQGLLDWMRSNLHPILRNSIDFQSQTLSQDACLSASTGDEFATVDLSAASDRMSCKVVERLFASNEELLQLLYASRTSLLTDKVTMSFQNLEMKKFAAQGAAVTFPVQTVLYTCCVIASIIYDSNKNISKSTLRTCSKKVRVYGDDIIMPSTSVETLDRLLTILELKVNKEKSFSKGPFRESCGMDAYLGHDVTPCYIKTDCPNIRGTNLQSWIDVSNNAHEKGLFCLSSGMVNMIPLHFKRRMYYHSKPTNGFSVHSSLHCDYHPVVGDTIKLKYDSNLHQWLIPSLKVRRKSKMHARENILSLTQFFTECPQPEFPWESGFGENVYAERISPAWVYPRG